MSEIYTVVVCFPFTIYIWCGAITVVLQTNTSYSHDKKLSMFQYSSLELLKYTSFLPLLLYLYTHSTSFFYSFFFFFRTRHLTARTMPLSSFEMLHYTTWQTRDMSGLSRSKRCWQIIRRLERWVLSWTTTTRRSISGWERCDIFGISAKPYSCLILRTKFLPWGCWDYFISPLKVT